jgi:hypothetical protein
MQGKSRKNKGYILIEAIIAITIAVVGLLGIFSLLSRSLSLNRVVADRIVASYLAAEGIEIVKNLIDNNILAGKPWNEGLSTGTYEVDYTDTGLRPAMGRYININAETGAYGYAELVPTLIKRTIAIRNSADGEVIIVGSRANWTTRGGGKFDINLEEHLFHWR